MIKSVFGKKYFAARGENCLEGSSLGLERPETDRERGSREVTVIQEKSRVLHMSWVSLAHHPISPCFAQIGCTRVSMIQRLM